MWPLYALGLLFGLPKYPVNQYLTLSFRGLGFNVIETNVLSIPYIVGSCITMLAITAFSELANNRSFVSMAENAWLPQCFIALIALPDPIGPWAYFAISTRPSHSSRIDEQECGVGAEQNSLSIALQYLVQYCGTFFYYRWRNNQKAKKWDAMTPEEQYHYRTTTSDKGNKRLDFRFATKSW
ncbi:allantoate permease [Fusarium agapanthi]|uniref:Allantoate permease n=1 Tax=Fusarium agapanthi TaxID=1803897 RepID=A0A9P5AX86_9HYPO|nr:allantoate permease [Fusarium agapanthi]